VSRPFAALDHPLVAAAVDGLLEVTIAPSFSRAGYLVRSRMERWVEPPRLEGRTVVVTGSSSGIGRAAAVELARLGAAVWIVGRDGERAAEAAAEARAASAGAAEVHTAIADLVDPASVAGLVRAITEVSGRVDGLVHNAGALFDTRRVAPDGTELTVATSVLAPFRLSLLLRPLLAAGGLSVIVTVSSGGMYTQGFDLDHLEMTPDEYRGAIAYARAKRAQVVLSHEWARRWGPEGVASHAVHPGWVDTPGVEASLPHFSRLGPALRRPAEGADTIVWLVAQALASPAAFPTQGFWHDRHLRGEAYLPSTRRSPEQAREDGIRLWDWCAERTDPTGGA